MGDRLQKLLNGYDMGQLAPQDPTKYSDRWPKCCAMFNINPATLKRHEQVAVYGLRTKLYQYQAFAVYWQMFKSREIGGGFIGDDPGLGKTLTYLAYLVCERQLTILEEAVFKARKEGNFRQHRSADHPDDGQGCPSYPSGPKPGWITCPCYKASPTYGMAAKPGVRLAVVPDHLVRDWYRSFVTHVDVSEENMLKMRVVVADSSMFPTGKPGADPRDSRNSATHNLVQADKKPLGRTGRYADDEPHAAQDRILVITTSKQYSTWVKTFEYTAIVDSKGKFIKGKNPGIVFGIAMADEFHDEPLKDKGRCGVLCSLPTGNWNVPFIWGYSGTPFSGNPRTLERVLWAIESHYPVTSHADKRSGWVQKDVFRHLSNPVFDQLCKDFQQLVKNKSRHERATEDVIIRFKHFLNRFMLRRTTDTKWEGGSMIKLNPSTHRNIVLEHNPAFDEAIQALTRNVENTLPSKFKEFQAKWDKAETEYQQRYKRPTRLTARTELMLKWRLRVIATCPYLARLATLPEGHADRLDLGIKEFLTFRNPHAQAGSPYVRYLNDIVQSSPKLAWLRKFITELKQTTDVEGKEQKLVIITNFNPIALIMKLVSCHFTQWSSITNHT